MSKPNGKCRKKSIPPEEADKSFALPYIIEASFGLLILYVQILIQEMCACGI